MSILAIETSTRAASVALLQPDRAVADVQMPSGKRTAAWLAMAVKDLLDQNNCRTDTLQAIALSHGPGSFTGLRVGVTFAKVFAYALRKLGEKSGNPAGRPAVLAVDTLEVIAAQANQSTTIHAVMDAGRGEVFHAIFQSPQEAGPPQRVTPSSIVQPDALVANLSNGHSIIGSGIRILGNLPDGVEIADESDWQPRAATVGKLGWNRLQQNELDDLWTLAPAYLRPSYAEEARARN